MGLSQKCYYQVLENMEILWQRNFNTRKMQCDVSHYEWMPCIWNGMERNRIVVTFILKRLLYVYAFRLNEPEQSRLSQWKGAKKARAKTIWNFKTFATSFKFIHFIRTQHFIEWERKQKVKKKREKINIKPSHFSRNEIRKNSNCFFNKNSSNGATKRVFRKIWQKSYVNRTKTHVVAHVNVNLPKGLWFYYVRSSSEKWVFVLGRSWFPSFFLFAFLLKLYIRYPS